jgi:hypothetical protein
VLGAGLTALAGPKIISLWYKPISQDAFSCAQTVHDALAKFVWLQLTTAVLGSIALLLLPRLFRRKKKVQAV